IQFRMQTDVTRRRRLPRDEVPAAAPNAFQRGLNWFALVAESFAVVIIVGGAGAHCASRAYCEVCRRWMDSETLKLTPGRGYQIYQLLEAKDYAAIREQLVGGTSEEKITSSLTLEHCSDCAEEGRASPVYLSVEDLMTSEMSEPFVDKVFSLL